MAAQTQQRQRNVGFKTQAAASAPQTMTSSRPTIQNPPPHITPPLQPTGGAAPSQGTIPVQMSDAQQKATDGTVAAAATATTTATNPSPLTARLNFSFATAPTASYATPLAPSTTALVAPASSAAKTTAPVATKPSRRRSATPTTKKRGRDTATASAVSEDEEEKQRRRMDRNLREQQRSHRITEQIGHLRDVLAAANIHFKPDKYSTLVSVVDYIKELQSRSTLLDSEHKKLLETIAKTNEMVNSPYYPNSDDAQVSNDLLCDAPSGSALEDETAVFVRGLDYKNVFRQCGIALAIASIDGRFMDCNPEFESLTGYARDELLPGEGLDQGDAAAVATTTTSTPTPDETPSASQMGGVPATVTTTPKRNLSLFNLLGRQDMEQVFLAMSRMLKKPVTSGSPTNVVACEDDKEGDDDSNSLDVWSGKVTQSRREGTNVSLHF